MPVSKQGLSERTNFSLNRIAPTFVASLLLLAGSAGANGEVISLKNPTATISMSGGWNVSLLTDGTTNDVAGWSGYNTSAGSAGPEVAVFETETNVGFATGSVVKFSLFNVNHNPQHTLGRFRLSYTTDPRDAFADGLNSGGDVTANWIVITPKEVSATGGAALSTLGDGSILASGENPDKSIYTVVTEILAQGITGFRLEAMEDASLPASGPGRYPSNGNFVLSELSVEISSLPPSEPVDYVLSRDFSPTNNPNGPWSYGAKPSFDGPFSAFGIRGLNPFEYWQLVASQEPTIYRNGSTNTITMADGQGVFPPQTTFLYSGTDGATNSYGVVRFTVPATSNYIVQAVARPVYDGNLQGDTDFHVVRNGAELFGQFLAPSTNSAYSNLLALAVGDELEFLVGRGADNSGSSSGLKIEVVVTPAASPLPPPPLPLVVNGSFELGTGIDSQLNAPDSTSLPGWTVLSGNIDYIGPVWAAGDGERCLDMSGTTAGTIAQTISGLTPGQTYKLSFLMAVNPNFPPPSADLRVIVGSTSNLFSMSVAGTSSNLGWQEKTAEFTASNTEAVLQFASLNQGWSGPLLDRVAVVVSTNVPPPPPPSTLIANGSFEIGTSVDSQINAPNSTSIEGWTVVSGNIDYVGTSWVAGDGVRCLDLSGVTAGTISQTISGLTVGHAYRLSFLMAVNPNAPPPTTDLLVTVGGESSQFSVTTAGTANNLGWVEQNMVFVASGTEAVLVFTSLNSGWAGPVLDRVAMQSLGVPPPAPECVAPPAGIVGWWPLDGDGQDVAIGNTASFAGDPEFRAGKVGSALGFDGANDLVRIPGGAPLDVGTGAGFTIEGWINPGDLSQLRPIAEWNSNSGVGGIGVHIWTGSGNRSLVANLVDATGTAHGFATPASLVRLGAWQHVALTYDKSSGVAVIYHDGVAAAQSNLGVFTPKTTGDLYLGNRPSGPFSGIYWRGGIDEFSVYNHALSATNVAAIYAASGSGKCGLATNAVPPWLVVQPQSQGVIKSETVSLSVVAAGSPTLQYQWRKGDVDLEGATNSTLTLSNVSMSAAGAYAVVVTNDFGAITSAVANIVVNLGPTRLRVISVTTTAEGQVDLPVEMVANGNENAIGFSLTFNPTLLRFVDAAPNGATPDASLIVNTNQLESGRLGLALALPAEAVFPEGIQEVVRVSFEAVSATQSAVASVGFGDQPVLRQVSDVAAVPLTATYAGGTVTIEVAGLEADVAPRPGGNNTLTVIDWVQLGRYVAALDTITNSLEYQKADSAPRSTRGNGVITVSDWVQAGRYAAGLDPLRPAGGPSEPMVPLVAASGIQAASGRVLTIPATNALPRTTLALPVWLESTGNENALAFTLSFDAGNLQFIGASKAGKMSAATLNLNTNQSPAGKVGVAMALPVGTAMSAGLDSIMVLYFAVSPTATGTGAFSFGDSPVFREVADVAANSLSTTFTAASVTFGPPREVGPPLTAARSGNSILLFWPSSASGFDVYSAANPDSASWVKVPGTPVSIGGQWFMTTPISTGNQYFRLEKR